MPKNGGGLMVPNAEEARFLRAVEAPAPTRRGTGVLKVEEAPCPKRQRSHYAQSGGDRYRKMEEASVSLKRRRPLPQIGGSP